MNLNGWVAPKRLRRTSVSSLLLTGFSKRRWQMEGSDRTAGIGGMSTQSTLRTYVREPKTFPYWQSISLNYTQAKSAGPSLQFPHPPCEPCSRTHGRERFESWQM